MQIIRTLYNLAISSFYFSKPGSYEAVYVISYDIYKRVLYLRRYNNILIFSIENKICEHYFKKMSPSFV